jgi:hypothetical protein
MARTTGAPEGLQRSHDFTTLGVTIDPGVSVVHPLQYDASPRTTRMTPCGAGPP